MLPSLLKLEKTTGKLCRDVFQMGAGTSAGNILVACIAAGLPIEEVIDFWKVDVPHVFNLSPALAWPARIAKGYAFDSNKIKDALVKRLGPAASWSLNDCPMRILLCATKVNQEPLFLVQDRPKNAKTTGKLSLVDCVVASAAAPTYLSPWYINPLGGQLVGWSMDGGIACVANPVLLACIEAFDYDDFDPAGTRVISLGTGFTKNTAVNPPDGFVGMLSLVIDSGLYNAGKQQTWLAERLFPGSVKRFNWDISTNYDMADAAAVPAMLEQGEKIADAMDWDQILQA